jgi:hypothetical protein
MAIMEFKEVRLEAEETNPRINKEEVIIIPPHNQGEVIMHHLQTLHTHCATQIPNHKGEVQTTEETLKKEKEASPVLKE